MDFKLWELLRNCVLVIMVLELQWRPVFSAPTHNHCELLHNFKSFSSLLRLKADELLITYTTFHGNRSSSTKDDLPDYTVSGVNISEQLKDVYAKNLLFHSHLLIVKEQQSRFWANTESVVEPLSDVIGKVSLHLGKVETLLRAFCPGKLSLPTAAPPEVSVDHSYPAKDYGWHVIARLGDWQEQVLQLLEKMISMCKKKGFHYSYYSFN